MLRLRPTRVFCKRNTREENCSSFEIFEGGDEIENVRPYNLPTNNPYRIGIVFVCVPRRDKLEKKNRLKRNEKLTINRTMRERYVFSIGYDTYYTYKLRSEYGQHPDLYLIRCAFFDRNIVYVRYTAIIVPMIPSELIIIILQDTIALNIDRI